MQSSAAAGTAAWKLRKWSPIQGMCTVYTTTNNTKVVNEKSGLESIFDKDPKDFLMLNPHTKCFHKEAISGVKMGSNLASMLDKMDRSEKRWVKLTKKRQIAGQAVEGYKAYTKEGTLTGEAWYFVDRPCLKTAFLTALFDIQSIGLEPAEVTWYKGNSAKPACKTLSVEKVSLPPDFFKIPKDCKFEANRFSVIGGAMDNIEGFATDFLVDPATRSKAKRADPKRQ